jgi:foldase protein PrsA
MKKVLIATLAVMLLLTGCKKVPQLENGQDKVASLTNDGISVDDLYDQMKSKYALNVLINMVDEKLLNEKYESTDEEKEYIENGKKTEQTLYGLYYYSIYQTYESYLNAKYGYTSESELDDYFKLEYRRDLVTKEYAKTLITDSDIKSYYDDEYVPEMEASHILITVDYPEDADDKAKAQAEQDALNTAKEIIKKLDNGEKFEDLAKEYSKDKGSAAKGGALGKFGHGGMVEAFEKAAYKLKVNEYTKEPVKTEFGYHIILKTKEYEKKSLESVKEEIIDILVDEKKSEVANISEKALIDFREKNGFVIEDSTLKAQYETYIYNVQ